MIARMLRRLADLLDPQPRRPFVLTLGDYELANLRAAIEATGFLGDRDAIVPNPLIVLNTGYWIASIYWRLPRAETEPDIPAADLARMARDYKPDDASSTLTPASGVFAHPARGLATTDPRDTRASQ